MLKKTDTEQIRILLIEDDQDDSFLITDSLGAIFDQRATVDHCMTIKECEEILQKSEFDLIILDLLLPDGDGLFNIYTIKDLAPKTPIILISGLEDMEKVGLAINMGAKDFLFKRHLNHDVLQESIRRSLS